MLDKPINEAYSIDVAIPDRHNFYSTITEKLQKCTYIKEELTAIREMNAVCTGPLVLVVHKRHYPKKPTQQLKTAHPSPWPIYSQAACSYTITCCIVRKLFSRIINKKWIYIFFKVYGSVYSKYIPIYIQQNATLYSLLYLETALHVSGGTSTHHQERMQPYLRHLVFVQIPNAVDRVLCAPDDGWRYNLKQVEQFPDINKLCKVASCWIYIGI